MRNFHNNKLRIGIDGRALTGDLAGVGRYIFELCRGLDKYFPNAEFVVFSQGMVKKPVVSSRWIYKEEKIAIFKRIKSIVWLKTIGSFRIFNEPLDFYWAGATTLPLFLKKSVITISTVHDFVFRLYPETMATHTLAAFRLFFNVDLSRSNIILTNSHGTANKLQKFYRREAHAVIQPGFAPFNEVLESKKSRTKPYILCVATIEPRKNLDVVLGAFLLLKKEIEIPHELLIVGKVGWKHSAFLRSVTGKPDVSHLGHVRDEELAMLYREADVFVFPSLYEGFGMPVQEARAYGARVIATDSEEIREAGGPEVTYIDPSVENLKKALFETLSSCASVPATPFFTWDSSAKKFSDVIVEYLQKKIK